MKKSSSFEVNFANIITNSALSRNLDDLATTIKILCYKESSVITESLNLNNNSIFLDPLLFAYFNQYQKINRPSLDQLLIGYASKRNRVKEVKVVFESNNTAYLPKIGYLILDANESPYENYVLRYDAEEIKLFKGSVSVSFKLIKPLYINKFEIFLYESVLFSDYFDGSNYNGHNNLMIEQAIIQQINNLSNAISIITKRLPDFFKQCLLTNRRIFLFNFDPVNSFATKQVHGCIFLNVNKNSTVSSFIDDLVHQWSHNVLNTIVEDMNDFFLVDANQVMMSQLTDRKNDVRSVYDAFHGLFTVSQRISVFKELYKHKIDFSQEEYCELIARFCDQQRRFKTGLDQLNLNEIYTPKGIKLYNLLTQRADVGLKEISHLLSNVTFSNQVSRFSYEKFRDVNDLPALLS